MRAPRDSTTAEPIGAEPELIDEAVIIANPGDVLLTRVVGELDARAPRDSTTADPIDAEPELIDEAVVIASVDLNPGDVLLTRVVGELDAIVDEGRGKDCKS